MLKFLMLIVFVTAFTTVLVEKPSGVMGFIKDFIIYGALYIFAGLGAFIAILITAFVLAEFELGSVEKMIAVFALVAALIPGLAGVKLLGKIRRGGNFIGDVIGSPALIHRGHDDYFDVVSMNNFSLVLISVIVIISNKANIYLTDIHPNFKGSYLAYIVIPIYVLESIYILTRIKSLKAIPAKIEDDNKYLAANLIPLYKSWRKDLPGDNYSYQIEQAVKRFNRETTEKRLQLTNTVVYKESAKILGFLEELKSLQAEDKEEGLENLAFKVDMDTYEYDSMRSYSENMYKGLGAEEVLMRKISPLGGVVDNITLEKNGQTVELDAIIINDSGVYLVEVKNYRADTIVFESSGMAYREGRNKSERMDILDQVSRARDIVRDIIGPSVNIYNVIVFADNNTRIIDNMNHENIKVVHMDFISFLFQNQTDIDPENKEIKNRLLEARTSERKYDVYDIYGVKSDFVKAIDKDIISLEKILDYQKDFSLIEKEIKEVKGKLKGVVGSYAFERSDRRLILNYYNEMLGEDRDSIKKYLERLSPEIIKERIDKLDQAKLVLLE